MCDLRKIIVSKFYHVNIYPTLSDRARSISAGIAKLRQIIVSNVKTMERISSRIRLVSRLLSSLYFFANHSPHTHTYVRVCMDVRARYAERSRRTYDAGDHPTLRHRHTLSLSRSNASSIATAH